MLALRVINAPATFHEKASTMMSTSNRFIPNTGIAIGPILFVIAILAILAMAIAAGSGSFTASSSQENAKTMAASIIDNINNIETAVQLIEGNGYTYQQVSFEIPSSALTIYADGSDASHK